MERKAHSYSTLHRLSTAITGTSLRTMSSRTWPSRASPPSLLRSQTLRIRREITGITCRPLGRDPILTTALRSVAKAVPSPCLSNAFVAKAVPFPCVFPMISWLRQCLRLVVFAAERAATRAANEAAEAERRRIRALRAKKTPTPPAEQLQEAEVPRVRCASLVSTRRLLPFQQLLEFSCWNLMLESLMLESLGTRHLTGVCCRHRLTKPPPEEPIARLLAGAVSELGEFQRQHKAARQENHDR